MTEKEVKDKLFSGNEIFGVHSYMNHNDRKVVIKAMKYTGFNTAEMMEFTGIDNIDKNEPFDIPTLRGKYTCIVGDHVIKLLSTSLNVKYVKGEFYPMPPNEFRAKYIRIRT